MAARTSDIAHIWGVPRSVRSSTPPIVQVIRSIICAEHWMPKEVGTPGSSKKNQCLNRELEQAKLELKLERQNKFATNQQKQDSADSDVLDG